jgi:hypothetical protein
MSSGLPLKADIARCSLHVSNVGMNRLMHRSKIALFGRPIGHQEKMMWSAGSGDKRINVGGEAGFRSCKQLPLTLPEFSHAGFGQ